MALTMLAQHMLAPIIEINNNNNVSGFREELKLIVPEIGQTRTVRNCCFRHLLPVSFCHEWLLWVSGGDHGDGNLLRCVPFSFLQQREGVLLS